MLERYSHAYNTYNGISRDSRPHGLGVLVVRETQRVARWYNFEGLPRTVSPTWNRLNNIYWLTSYVSVPVVLRSVDRSHDQSKSETIEMINLRSR